MITPQQIRDILDKKIAGTPVYIVDVTVSPGNKIVVLLDRDDKLSLNDCVEMSRFIESNLNRDVEDFELEVSSPGLDRPLKIARQYIRHQGKQVRVVQKNGRVTVGKLIAADEQGIRIEEKSTERTEGKKGRQLVVRETPLSFNEIKETTLVISFN